MDTDSPSRGKPRRRPAALDREESALRRLILEGDESEAVARVVVEGVIPRLAAFLVARFPGLAVEDGQDIAGDALRVAIERRARFDLGRKVKLRTWLYGIAKHRAADFFRMRGPVLRLVEDSWNGDGERDSARRRGPTRVIACAAASRHTSAEGETAVLQAIREAILGLPEQQRRAAEACFLEHMTPRQAEVLYGWSPNTANVYLWHARRYLRARLAALGVAPGQMRTQSGAAQGSTEQENATAEVAPRAS